MNKNNFYISITVALVSLVFALIPASAQANYYYYYPQSSSNSPYYPYSYTTNYYPSTNYYGGSYSGSYGYYGQYSSQTNYPLVVSCAANTTSIPVGSSVTWIANVSGGNGLYSFTWNGTDGLYGSQSTAVANYHLPGVKTATVYVTSAGQQRSMQCSNTVTVGIPANVVQNNIYTIPTVIGVQAPSVAQAPVPTDQIKIACFADKAVTKVGVPVTWAVEAVGAGDNFTYAWTGSDGLSGNQSSVITTYTSTGLKSAVVTATSANGKSQSKACGNTVSVQSSYTSSSVVKAPAKPTPPPASAPTIEKNDISAAALFSLQYVPWGLVAVLVIIILFVTVLYLIFNRKKI